MAGALLPVPRSELGAGAWGQQVGRALGPPQQQVEVPRRAVSRWLCPGPEVLKDWLHSVVGSSWGGCRACPAGRGTRAGARPVAPSTGQDTQCSKLWNGMGLGKAVGGGGELDPESPEKVPVDTLLWGGHSVGPSPAKAPSQRRGSAHVELCGPRCCLCGTVGGPFSFIPLPARAAPGKSLPERGRL